MYVSGTVQHSSEQVKKKCRRFLIDALDATEHRETKRSGEAWASVIRLCIKRLGDISG